MMDIVSIIEKYECAKRNNIKAELKYEFGHTYLKFNGVSVSSFDEMNGFINGFISGGGVTPTETMEER